MFMQDNLKGRYLSAMGIQQWLPRGPVAMPPPHSAVSVVDHPAAQVSTPAVRQEAPAATDSVADLGWEALRAGVAACRACALHETRTHTVFGVGNQAASWIFVGEAPGADEDRQGEPFVGRAGQLLNAMITALHLKRTEVYITNVLKCRPPNNRDPQPAEVVHCEPYLRRQIALIQPQVIVALGRHAAHSLLKSDLALSRLRGTCHDYHGTPLIATYHPAYLLRTPADKARAWDDLVLARAQVSVS